MIEIFKYIDRIMLMVRPRKLLYLAIDGVAPRAKMNQQRSRRFRAAMEASQKAEAAAAAAEDNGVDVDESEAEPFDSNCITPGTPFMHLVSESLKYYTIQRMNNDAGWKDIKVIFSDASVPGEGEHKIMDFIRRQRLDPSYNPNTRHVIYGLDADLIMLSMATHEPYFKVLREDVFAAERNKNCRKCGRPGHFADQCPGAAPPSESADGEYKLIEKPFLFLDIPILREYLEAEMRPSGEIPYRFDAERAIDDWIFLCFFVGNDFLPHLPSLEIREGAIDILIDIYKSNAARLGGYICTDGVVNLTRAAIIMEELGKLEETIFRKRREKEERYLENSKRRRMQADMQREADTEYRRTQIALHQAQTQVQAAPVNVDEMDNAEIVRLRAQLREQNMAAAKALRESLQSAPAKRPADDQVITSKDDEEPEDNVKLWEPGFRERYYRAKFDIDAKDDPVGFMNELSRAYAEGLCWVMAYYYQGCPSWKWFYPFHYAPFAADLATMGQHHVRFELGEPFRPFDQLMGVFPAASSSHIPEPFRPLMTEPESEVIDFYPETFHIDLNGKKAAWQGVALLPFIDETRLLQALETVYPSLTPEQVRLNARGDPKLFAHSETPPRHPDGLSLDAQMNIPLSLDPSECANIAGMVKLDTEVCQVNAEVPSPISKLPAIHGNQVHCFHFQLPYHERRSLHFRARLLPGVTLPERRLTEEDRYSVHSGAASRSFSSRLILGPVGRQGFHSMHREYNQAQERRHEYSGEQRDYRRPREYERRDQQRDYERRDQRDYPPQRHQTQYAPQHQQPQYAPPQCPPTVRYPPPPAGMNPYAALAPQHRPEELYPPPPPAGYIPPMPPVPPPGASAFHRPQPRPPRDGSGSGQSMDDLYGLRRR